mmetsp:Transcript_99092/g.196423  ORF Transcript_99092/g.196423 Transcript_99092/m.196423 type:complete len:132 (-) Transcript_99092:109-504(-)
MAEWNQAFCAPSLPCCLTCCACGCIPVYQIIDKIAPFNVVCLPVERGMAILWALLFWIGTIYAVGQGTVVFAVLVVLFAVAAKNKLGMAEDSLYTAVKMIFCTPCMVGQIAGQALGASAREYMPLEDPIDV